MLEEPIITLTTDFGLKDPYVGLMKGVILGINPKARIIDITHSVQRHNIYEASQVLDVSYKFFPTTTLHIVVVDPGVGSNRRPIMVATDKYYFIGPDNGVFSTVYEDAASGFMRVFHLTASHYFLPMSGSTFHGRDIFAPVAAYLSKGVGTDKFGEQINDYHRISVPRPVKSGNSISGEIIAIDSFGNAISNIKKEDITAHVSADSAGRCTITFNNIETTMVHYYAEHQSSELSAIINSFGNLELFVFQGSAADKFHIKIGDRMSVNFPDIQ
ncbi:MAG: SAM-dependent chlorinase/fluorinase [Nitrospiraceae bacterium]|nr:MAG: SAM-dependent chlorinase/fluorinase [Nitrospiraceae bacterium]